MEIYYIIFAILFFSALILDTFTRLSPSSEFALFMMFSLCLFLFAGLRTTGLEFDYSVYRDTFNEIASISELSKYRGYKIEYGYMLFNRLFSWGTFHTFIFALAFITILPKEIYIYENCSKKFIALAYYYSVVFLQSDMGLLRTAVSSAILYYAFNFLSRDEKYKFICSILLASLFHTSSLLMLLLLIPGTKKYSFRTYVYILIAGFIFSVLHVGMPILNFVANNLTQQGSLIGKIQTYYSHLVASGGGGGGAITRILLSNAKKIILFVMFSYLMSISQRTFSEKKRRLLLVWYNSYFISILLPLAFMDLGGLISHRGTLVFRPVEIFLLSELYEAVGKKKVSGYEMLAEKFLLLLFMCYLMYHNMIDIIYGYSGYVPYTWDF